MSKAEAVVSELIGQMESLTLRSRAIDEAPFGITIADVRKEDDPLIYVNDGFTAMTGYAESEILGRNCRFLQGPETEPEPVAKMRQAIESGESVQVELRNYRNDDSMFWNQVTLAPLENEQDEITHYVGFQQNISSQKSYEQELKEQRDDLRVLDEMVRHDIRNDLQVALAALEVLQAQDEKTTERNEQITTALESIHQAIDLTDTAGDIAEVLLDTGTPESATSLTSVLEEQIQQCQATYPDASIDVVETLPRVSVQANELLGSVFRNLLTNAIAHNDKATPKLKIAGTTDDDWVRVVIADNGPGIPKEDRDRLFERGWKGGTSGGTGMGLYIVNRLVENYGGTIELREDPPEEVKSELAALGGATFVVELPRAD